jgi:hypothetical protein
VLSAIDLPTLLLHARNDPFMTPACVPAAHELSASTRLEISDDGGHVGFVSGNWPWRARYWLENRIMAFLAEHLADKTGTGQMVQDVPFINNTG